MYCIPYYVYHAAVFHMKTNLTNRTISSSSSYNIPTDTTSNSSSMRTVYLQFTFYLSSKLHCRLHIFPRGINYRVVLHIASRMCFHSTVLSQTFNTYFLELPSDNSKATSGFNFIFVQLSLSAVRQGLPDETFCYLCILIPDKLISSTKVRQLDMKFF